MSVFIVSALRTAIGKYAGALCLVRPDDLLTQTVLGLLAKFPELEQKDIEEIVIGAANQSGEDNRNVARMAVLLANLPVSIAGITVNRLCASGLQAIIDAFRAINTDNDSGIYLAGGVESMSRAPFVVNKSPNAFDRHITMMDTTMGWRFTNPKFNNDNYYPFTMGETAENIAKHYQISRKEQDEFAYYSQLKYNIYKNKFQTEIITIIIESKKESIIFKIDEHPRLTELNELSNLSPAFLKNGTVTVGNSSGINDGASVLMLCNEFYVNKYSWQPIVTIKAVATIGVEPEMMGLGPIPAVKKVLSRANLSIKDIGLWELNEAFAVQSLACIRDLSIDPEIVNVNGGAIALGHPLGCSGARISTTLIHEMQRRQTPFGIATMCVGLGQGVAVVYELCT